MIKAINVAIMYLQFRSERRLAGVLLPEAREGYINVLHGHLNLYEASAGGIGDAPSGT